jgi:hypothetical protein
MEMDKPERLLRAYFSKRISEAATRDQSSGREAFPPNIAIQKSFPQTEKYKREKPWLSLLLSAAALLAIFSGAVLKQPSAQRPSLPLGHLFTAAPLSQENPLSKFLYVWEASRPSFQNATIIGDSL